MVERLKKIIEKENSNPSSFADYIGISRSTMNHLLNKRNNPSLDVLMKILEKYPDISSDWLLFGKEPMYKGGKVFLQPSLFDEEPLKPELEPAISEYRKENELKPLEKAPNNTTKEEITISKTISKTIGKIIIYYSDNTFETFIPENR